MSGRTDWQGASAHTHQDCRLQGRFQTPHWGAPSPPEQPPGRTVQQRGGPQCFLWVRSTVSSDGNTHTRTMNRGAEISPPAGQTVCPMSDLEGPAFSPQHAHCSFLTILTTAPSPSLLPDLTCDSRQQMLSFSMTFFQTGFQTDGFPGRSQNHHRTQHPTPECRPWSATEPTIASRWLFLSAQEQAFQCEWL